ncbi:hypothetical protein, partial [Escherichia coli]|uniref:hypothetical protein n=1 Tax=Escherichia coli TaxID=562 RepID=UPI001656D8A0
GFLEAGEGWMHNARANHADARIFMGNGGVDHRQNAAAAHAGDVDCRRHAHKDAGIGMIGAGIVHPPFACFEKAIFGWCERYGV